MIEGTSSSLLSRLKAFLRPRLIEAGGLILLGFGVAGIVALASYSSSDPSRHTVGATSNSTINNWLGESGAWIAAEFIEMIGIVASLALMVVLVVWGGRVLFHRGASRMRLRLGLLPLVLGLICFLASEFDPSYGGALGAILFNQIGSVAFFAAPLPEVIERFTFGMLVRWEQVALGFLGVIGIYLYFYVASIGRSELSGVRLVFARSRWFFGSIFGGFKRSGEFIRGGIGSIGNIGRGRVRLNTLRPAPSPRREPIIITNTSDDDIQPQVPSARQKAKLKQPQLDLDNLSGYNLPPRNLIAPPSESISDPDKEVLDTNSRMLESVLAEFGIKGNIKTARFGPIVTRYELELAPGIKTQRVIGLADDIARSMSALSVRIAVVPGQNLIGIELPNADNQTVLLRDILDSDEWANKSMTLPMALGVDIAGKPVVADLARMPHLLVAGTTGSGKSVGINGMILSLLYTHTPETCRLIMIDPKMLELSVYEGIPHLMTPVVTDPGKAVQALKWAVREMESRYRNMSKLGVRNIEGYNKRLEEARNKGEVLQRRVQTGFDNETGMPIYEEEALDLNPLPFLVVVIDEVADLMMTAGKDIEAAVQRLAQMARAAGIHVIMATQRPSVDVITGTIKANFPMRISFQVTSKVDSRTVLGEQGAEQLLGRGDMLYMQGGGRVIRVHGPFVSESEVGAVAQFLREQGEPVYDDKFTAEVLEAPDEASGGLGDLGLGIEGDDASLYDQAVALVVREGKASTSFIQRHLRIGYNRAATIIEEMEKNGVVSPANHAGKREVLIDA